MVRVRLAKISAEPVPVVEVYGFTYSNLPRPEGASAWERPDLWDTYFQRCMADAGFGEVRTIVPAVSFVVVHDLLASPLLERQIRDEFDSSKADRLSEENADPAPATSDTESWPHHTTKTAPLQMINGWTWRSGAGRLASSA